MKTGRATPGGVALRILGLSLVALAILVAPVNRTAATIPISGPASPGMESYDTIIPALMQQWSIPGGAVAVVKDGRLVLGKGYGWADQQGAVPAQPDSLFRIASLTKSITSAAIFKLVEQGKLNLNAPALAMLPELHAPPGATVDPRLQNITILNLLQHSGGWDRYATFDPMFDSTQIAQSLGVAAPASPDDVIRYMLGQPLQFDPGTQYSYSNFGYCILGRIIEKVTGQSYSDFVQSQILGPSGTSCLKLAKSRLQDRLQGEVLYYDFPGAGLATSVFPGVTQPVPWPYGGFYIEAMDSHGGWLASAVDLLRFVNAIEGRGGMPNLLKPATVQQMLSRPNIPVWNGSAYWYAAGWLVRPSGGDANWWHDGSLPGTTSWMVRAYNGLTWVAIFNSRPSDFNTFEADLDNALWQAVGGVTSFPTGDLFAQFGTCTEPPPAPGPQITSAAFSGRKNLTMLGSHFGTAPSVIINSVDQTGYVASASDSQINIKAKPRKLGLVTGNNTIQVIDAQGRASNEFTLTF